MPRAWHRRRKTHRPVLLFEQIGHKAPDLGSEQQTGLQQEKDLYFEYSRRLHFINWTTLRRRMRSLIVCNLTLILICTDFHMGPAWLTQPVTPSSCLPLPISSSLLLWPQFSISANVPISFIATAPLSRPSGSRRAPPFCPKSDLLVEPLDFLKIKIFDDTAVDGLCWYDNKSCSLSSYCECKRIIYSFDCMCFWCCPTGRTEFWRESRECGSHLFPGLIHNRLRWMPRSILLCIVLSDRQK